MNTISTHVLDLSIGRPAANVAVRLERRGAGGAWTLVTDQRTDADGRMRFLLGDVPAAGPVVYRLTFDTGAYFRERAVPTFLPEVAITFEVTDPAQHHHVPLLLSPFGFSTYRGS